ncbi:Arm DNA-binding domain-containing protein [Desulfovibrio cuneatus]|uniref:Arm DNA-binding domain-containing protein n=1 Tax=Desulfovibrio cuneatus TaxID=159728 RepID=UPI0004200252|nr:Arm DNA-binding domain-containing protein [Desulfovibrio cuneatus]
MFTAKQEQSKRFEFTVRFLETVKVTDKEERYTDAKTPWLTLAVKPSKRKKEGTKLWRFRYMVDGEAQMISLGVYPTVSLKNARGKAHNVRKMLDKGLDPSQKRRLPAITALEQAA